MASPRPEGPATPGQPQRLSSAAHDVLALHGGPRAIADGPPDWPIADEAVREALDRAYRDNHWGKYSGPHSDELVEALATYHGVAHAFLCCSGTFAVELALRAVGVAAEEEVILAGYDFAGNFRAVERVGARPVLVDIAAGSWSLDVAALDTARSSRTRAVIASHLHGTRVAMPDLLHWAGTRGIKVIEDACQCPGAVVAGKRAGSWGDVGVLSFGGSKLLTAGRGGALLMNDPQAYQRAKIFAEQGNHAFPLSELQAAVLLPQLAQLDERNRTRRARVDQLLAACGEIACLRPAAATAPTDATAPSTGDELLSEPAYYKVAWSYTGDAVCERSRFLQAVQAEGVALDAGFRGLATRRRARRQGTLPRSREAARATVLLHHPVLLQRPAEIEALAAALKKVADRLDQVAATMK